MAETKVSIVLFDESSGASEEVTSLFIDTRGGEKVSADKAENGSLVFTITTPKARKKK